jgi:hypothetical protein
MRCQHCCSYSPPLCMHTRAAEGLYGVQCARVSICLLSLVGRTRFMSFCPINCFACHARHAELLMLSDQFSHICRLICVPNRNNSYICHSCALHCFGPCRTLCAPFSSCSVNYLKQSNGLQPRIVHRFDTIGILNLLLGRVDVSITI